MHLAIVWLVGCSPLAHQWPDRMDVPILQADHLTEVPTTLSELRVVAWNIKFGAGRIDFWFDGFGERVSMSEEEVLTNLDGLRNLIATFNPDIILMEEIERSSKRSAYVDMVDWFLNDANLGYNYATYASNWKVNYVPDHGLGKVDMGNALFSKFPITHAERVDQGAIEEQDGLTKFFYLDRCFLRATVELPTGPLEVFVVHPDAYAEDGTKIRQVNQIYEEASLVEGDILIGGDFNVLPPGSLRLEDFADESDVSGNRGVGTVTYVGQQDVLVPWYAQWEEASEQDHGDGRLTLAQYQAATEEEQQVDYLSHSINKDIFWTQRLDYLFSNRLWQEGWVVQRSTDGPDETAILDPMTLSDHAPVWGRLILE